MSKIIEKYTVAMWMFIASFWFFGGYLWGGVKDSYMWVSGICWVVFGVSEIFRINREEKKKATEKSSKKSNKKA